MEVKHYVGEEITEEVISKVNDIIKKAYGNNFLLGESDNYIEIFEDCDNYVEFAMNLSGYIYDTHVLLADDWFLIYSVLRDQRMVCFESFAAIPNNNGFKNASAMKREITQVLLNYHNFKFKCFARAKTSYNLYKKGVKLGLIEGEEEKMHMVEEVFLSLPEERKKVIFDLIKNNEVDKLKQEPEYSYVGYDVIFSLTPKFLKQYGLGDIPKNYQDVYLLRSDLLSQEQMGHVVSLETKNDLGESDFEEWESYYIGKDWFLEYKELFESYILIEEWASEDKDHALERFSSMFGALKHLLLENKNATFQACLLPKTSYKLYKKTLELGFIEEVEMKDLGGCYFVRFQCKNKFVNRYSKEQSRIRIK